MLNNISKNSSRKNSYVGSTKNSRPITFLEEYRNGIKLEEEFSLKEVESYDTLSKIDFQVLESVFIDSDELHKLFVEALQVVLEVI